MTEPTRPSTDEQRASALPGMAQRFVAVRDHAPRLSIAEDA